MDDEKKKPDRSNISDITDTRSAADDVIDALDEEFPNAKAMRRDDIPYYPLTHKKGACPKCKEKNYTATPLETKTQYECRLCGNKWAGPLIAARRPKVMFLRESKSEKPLRDIPREPQTMWRRTR